MYGGDHTLVESLGPDFVSFEKVKNEILKRETSTATNGCDERIDHPRWAQREHRLMSHQLPVETFKCARLATMTTTSADPGDKGPRFTTLCEGFSGGIGRELENLWIMRGPSWS